MLNFLKYKFHLFLIFGAIVCPTFAFATTDTCSDMLLAHLISGVDSGQTVTIDTDSTGETVVMLSQESMVEFFVSNIETCRDYLVAKSGTLENSIELDTKTEFVINVNWDEIRENVAGLLNANPTNISMKLCENNRSYQVGIDVAIWTATAISAAATFWAGGAGGAVTAGIAQSAKVAAKAAAKKALQAAIKKGASRTASQLAKQQAVRAATAASRSAMKASINAAIKSKYVRYGIKVAIPAITYFGANALKQTFATKALSYLESKPSAEYLNCQDLDTHRKNWFSSNNLCYAVCGERVEKQDDFNIYVFEPILHKRYCVNRNDYGLYEIETGKLLTIPSPEIAEKINTAIKTQLQDKKGCNWSSDDIDMYVGFLNYDATTLQQGGNAGMTISNIIRVDE